MRADAKARRQDTSQTYDTIVEVEPARADRCEGLRVGVVWRWRAREDLTALGVAEGQIAAVFGLREGACEYP